MKDATPLLANIAVPATIRLVAQRREQWLAAAESFAPDEVARHRQAALDIRQTTADLKGEARLLARVEQLRELIEWGAAWQERLNFGAPPVTLEVHGAFVSSRAIARKVPGDREQEQENKDGKAKDRLLSLTDTDARRSKHGEFYHGYSLDVTLDADSDLICGPDVLAANADEAANARNLIESEEAAQGNNIESLSIDSIGFNGPVLKALSDEAAGPQLTVFVPPKPDWPATPDLYQPDEFKLNEKGVVQVAWRRPETMKMRGTG